VEEIMQKKNHLTLSLIGIGLLLAACSGQSSPANQPPEPVKYTVEMSEFAFSPNELQAKVGQEVTLELVNKGALAHELMIGREVKMHDSRPDGYQQDMFEVAHVEPKVMGGMQGNMGMGSGDMQDEHSGFMITVPRGGDNAMITFTTTQDMVGEWEIGCFEQDGVHYDAGMNGRLLIVP
jgi:plastocyanin